MGSQHTRGREVNKDELCDILGVGTAVIDNYLRNGCPVTERGGPGRPHKFNTADVHAWLREQDEKFKRQAPDPEKAATDEGRRRAALATARLRELELETKQGVLIAADAVRPVLEEQLSNVRSRLMAMPGRLSAQLVRMSDQGSIERLIAEEVREALAELTADEVEFSAAA